MQDADEFSEFAIPEEGTPNRLSTGERPLISRGSYSLPLDETPLSPHLDEKPIGTTGNYNLPSEEQPGEVEIEETGPLESRIESKAWKTRVKALEELVGLLRNEENPPFETYLDLIVKFISDSHAGAQENGLEILAIYIEKHSDRILSLSEGITKALIEKGISNTKASIKQKSSNILLDFYGIHRSTQEPFINGLIATLNNKNIKIQAAAISSVNSLICAYGAKALSFKPFVSIMEKHAGASNAQVRGEALNFYKETYKWVRDLIIPSVEKLKKAQQDELKKGFEEITEPPTATRWIIGQEPKAEESKAGGKKRGEIDIYDMADARDVFNKYNEKWADGVLAMEKWVEKKAALEELNAELNYPKLAEKNPIALTTMGKRLVNDANVNVMIQAMKMIGLLAKGQRKYFDTYAKQFLSAFLQKFKENKSIVIQEAHAALDNLMYSLSIDQALEDIKAALEDKAPSVKINTSLWLERVLTSISNDQVNKVARPIVLILKKNTDDSKPDVRNSCFKTLACLLNKCPEIINPILKDLPPAKMKKIEEAGGVATTKRDKSVDRTIAVEEEEKPEIQRRSRKSVTSAPQQANKPASNSKKPSLPPKCPSTPAPPDEDLQFSLSPEEVEGIISLLISGDTFDKLKISTNWKEKQAGFQEFLEWVTNNQPTASENSEAILQFVKICLKDWKENNFNVNKAAFDLISFISQNCNLVKRSASIVFLPQALDKLSDLNLVKPYKACISSICECVGPRFVVGLIIKNTNDCNKPKVASECCSIINSIISDYGIHTVSIKEVVDYAKCGISQTNISVKKSAQSLIVTIYSHIGDKLLPLISDIKEQTLKALQEEFSKTEIICNGKYKTAKGEEESKIDPNKALDSQFPRANISSQINAGVLNKLGDSNWRVRKEGLEAVEAIIDQSGMRILPAGLELLIKALKARLSDPNKSLVRQALGLSCKLAQALGSESVSISKSIIPGILTNLSDSNSLLRQDALAAIDKWSLEAGPESIASQCALPLLQESPDLRTELLNWLLAHKESFFKCDMKIMAPSILACLQDRSANIRNSAEILFGEIVNLVGFDIFQPFLTDIKPAVMKTLTGIFDKYRGSTEIINENLPRRPPISTKSGSRSNSKNSVSSVNNKKTNENEGLKTPKPAAKLQEQASLDFSITPILGKEKRLDYEAKHKWNVEELRQDYVDKLKADMKAAFSNDLFNLLYSSDFKKQIESIQILSSLLNSQRREMKEVIDLVFRFMWLKLSEGNNPQIYKALFEFAAQLINALQEDNYSLSEGEAMLFLPIFCEKSGHNNAMFRQMIRNIIHSTTKIHPPENVFLIVLQGLASKNARSKVECLDELTSLVQEFGSGFVQPRDIKTIAKSVNSPDNNVRNSAVGTIGECYKTIGDKIWSLIGEIPDKGKDLLEQRFKSLSGPSFSGLNTLKAPVRKKDEEISKVTTPRGNKIISFEDLNAIETEEDMYLRSQSEELQIPVKSPYIANKRHSTYTLQINKIDNEELPKSFSAESVGIPDKYLSKTLSDSSLSSLEDALIQIPSIAESSIQITNPEDNLIQLPTLTDASIQIPNLTEPPIISHTDQASNMQIFNKPLQIPETFSTEFSSQDSRKSSIHAPEKVFMLESPQITTAPYSIPTAPKILPQPKKEIIRIKWEENRFSAFEALSTPQKAIMSAQNIDSDPQNSCTELDKHIKILNRGDLCSRVDTLVELNEMIWVNLEDYEEEFKQKANLLIDAISKVFIFTFERPIEDVPLSFAKYFLNVVHKIFCTKLIMQEISENYLFTVIEQIFKRLLIENLEKIGEKREGEIMMRTLNGSMLKALEYCKPTIVFVVLIKILTKYINDTKLSKIPGLAVKCLLKLGKILGSIISELEIDKVLLAIHEYLNESKIKTAGNNDEMVMNAIKTIINELVILKGETIWELYSPIRSHEKPDENIEKWIISFLRNNNTNFMIKSPQIIKLPQDPILNSIFSRLNEELDYDSAIKELFEYIEKSPKAELAPYLSQISSDLYNKITEDIHKMRENKNAEKQQQAVDENYNIQEVQNRLAMMKQRYGLAASNQPIQLSTNLMELKAKFSNLLNRANE